MTTIVWSEGDDVTLAVKIARVNVEQALVEFQSADGPFSIRVPLSALSHPEEPVAHDRESLAWALMLGKWGGSASREYLEGMIARYGGVYGPWVEALTAADMVIAANWSPAPAVPAASPDLGTVITVARTGDGSVVMLDRPGAEGEVYAEPRQGGRLAVCDGTLGFQSAPFSAFVLTSTTLRGIADLIDAHRTYCTNCGAEVDVDHPHQTGECVGPHCDPCTEGRHGNCQGHTVSCWCRCSEGASDGGRLG